jgi:hypothetical protein
MPLRDDILAAQDRPIEPVATPEWPAVDGKLFLRTLSALEREHFAQSYRSNGDGKLGGARANVMARFCVLVLCDAQGQPVFTEADAVELGQKAGHVLDRIFNAARKLNKIGVEASEELLKNSASGPSAVSS